MRIKNAGKPRWNKWKFPAKMKFTRSFPLLPLIASNYARNQRHHSYPVLPEQVKKWRKVGSMVDLSFSARRRIA